jgi:hypothetical protein
VPRHLVAVAAVFMLTASAVFAHDVPNDIVVQAFVKPEPRRLRLLVRVPLAALRDVDVPTRGAGYLDLTRAEDALRGAATTWIAQELELYEGGERLYPSQIAAVLVSLPSDTSFQTYDRALAHVTGPPLDPGTELYWNQGVLDALIEYPIRSETARFAIRPGLERLGLRTTTALRLVRPDGVVRAFEMHGDPGIVHLDPTWIQAATGFVRLGFEHILSGADHLLFLLCLVIPLRRVRILVAVVTAFTVAHSVTLVASACDLAPSALWFPPLVETLIASSIVYMALENIVGARVGRRWLITFAFGLVHGFGFSFALRETLQFAGSHLLTSLLAFNVGVELGQLLVLAIAVPALAILFRRVDERMGTIILSAIVAHTGWHWMTARGEQLLQFSWPTVDPGTLAGVVRWVMVLVAAAAVWWLARVLMRMKPDSAYKMKPDPAYKREVEGGI